MTTTTEQLGCKIRDHGSNPFDPGANPGRTGSQLRHSGERRHRAVVLCVINGNNGSKRASPRQRDELPTTEEETEMTTIDSMIQVNRGDSPKRHEVLNLLVNNVFYEDGAPWRPTTEQIAGLTEIFGTNELAELRIGKAPSTAWDGQ